MANTITKHVMTNGTRNLCVSIVIAADGTGNYSNYTLLDLNEYQIEGEPKEAVNDFKVMKIAGRQGTGTSFTLSFGSDTESNRLLFDSSDNAEDFCADWTQTGGITSQVADTDLTLRLTTTGLDASGDVLMLTLWIKKKRS